MRRSRNLIPRFTLRHLPARASRIAVLAALSIFGCQAPPEEASTAVASAALLANGATCITNDQCSSGVCSGGVCVASPDLVIASITGVPAQVSAQQLVPASWTVRNQGAASARGSTVPCCAQTDHGSSQFNNIWFDRFFLSTDAALSTDDVFIGEFARPDNFTLAAGATYTANASVHIPTVAPGSYFLILVTDGFGNRVLESDDTNNTMVVPITVGQADLVVASLTGVPAQASMQQLLPVSWTVKNQAATGAASGSLVPCCAQTDHGSSQFNNIWFDRFFLSTDAALSTDDVFIGEFARPDNFTLAAGTSYTANASIHVPSVAPGSYFLIFVTDGFGNRVPESDDTNNTMAVPITVGQADLVVASLTGVPAQASMQQLLPVSWTVKNQAATGAASGSLVPCCTQTDHGSSQFNNIWFDRFFLSTDAALSTDDVFIGEFARPDNFTLAAGASYTANASIHVPSVAPGSYFLIFVTDGFGNRVPESNESNNTFSVPITVGQADLVVSALTGVPATAAQQQLLPVSWTVTNQATTGAASGSLVPCCAQTDHGSSQFNNIWFDRFFLSTDATLSADDRFLSEFARPDNFTLAAGTSYTANANIQLPAIAQGNYYIILVTDGFGNRVPESDETNNTIAVPITVGQADLVVASLTGVPAQTSTQQLLPVSWTVTNQAPFGAASGSLVPCCTQTDHGSPQFNHIWFDRFFLSTDATLSTDDVFIGEFARPDNFTLAAGASYTANASIHVPSVAPGSYFLILITDGFGNRVPESNENNNTFSVPVTVGQADLVVSSLTGVPGTAAQQQLLPVSWTVTNQATTGAASGSLVPCCTQTDHGSSQFNNIWFDRFFLSTDATLSTDDTFIGEFARPDNFTLAAGTSYTANASIHVPSVAPGSYFLILITDGFGNRVPESNEANNTIAVPITVGQADLVVSALTGVPGAAAQQQLLPVTWTVTNQATTGAASGSLVPCCTQTDHGSSQFNNIWFDRFFLSTDTTLSGDDVFIGEFPRPDNFTLAAGASYTASASIHVPSVAAGSYFLILVTDGFGNRVAESNENNNTFSVPITVGQADLVVSSLTGVPAQGSSQQLLPVSWTVKNQSTAGAASGSLVPCCTQTDHGSSQFNNIWFDRFFLSTDATLSTDDTFIGEYARPDNFTLAAGTTYTASATIQLPVTASGSYYVILVTDGFGNRVPESNEANNTIAVPITLGQADLVVSALTGVPAQASVQQLLPVSWTVTNQATTGGASGSLVPCCAQTDHGSSQFNHIWFDRFFLSTDATLSADDTFIGEYARPDGFTLAAGGSYTATASIQVPTVAAGSYYIILVTDGFGNRVQESNENNNVVALPMTVGQADLVVSSLTGVPAQASAQQLLPVTWTVTNQATAGAASGSLVPCCTQTDHGSSQFNHIWFDRFFLSTDATLSADDTFIAEFARPDNFTLAAGASYSASASIHVPTVAPGSYFLIFITDGFGNRVPESDDTNNTMAVPITVGQADLVVASLTGVPAQASTQQLLPVSWTVKNQATTGAASGSLVPCCTQTDHGSSQFNNIWFDRFFLSTDATLSTDDVFIGEFARPDNFTLAAGASYTANASIHVPSVAPGSYFLIFITDGFGNRVLESDDTNNTMAVPITVGQADLVVASLTGVPAQVSTQQLVPVSWTVKNQATTGAASGSLVPCCTQTDHGSSQFNNIWFDRFFLSTDAALSTDDVFIGEFARPDNFTLAAGASYTANASIHVPSVAPGSYFLIFVTDGFGNRVPESDDTNNTMAVPITVGQADLVVASLTGVPAQASAQQIVPVSWTVTNQAMTGAASGSLVPCCTQTDHGSSQFNNIWFDRFFLSTDAVLSADDVFVDEFARPDNFTLAAGASYTASASIHVPSVAPGSYYLIVTTDGYGNRVPESHEDNNTFSIPVTVGQADLVAISLTGMPPQASQRQIVPVSWTVTNQATTGAANGSFVPCCAQTDHGTTQFNNRWFDRFYLSADATFSADDTFVGEFPRPDNFTLPAGASYTASASIQLPSAVAPGSYYLLLVTDGYGNRVPESNETNNTIAVPTSIFTSVATQPSAFLPVAAGTAKSMKSPTFSPDGALLAAVEGPRVSLWSTETWTLRGTVDVHTATVNSVSFAPLGDQIVTAALDGSLQRSDTATRQGINVLAQPVSGDNPAAFSPDGARLISGSGNQVIIWDAITNTQIRQLVGHAANVSSVSLSPDGTHAATGGADGRVILWNVTAGTAIATINTGAVSTVVFSPSGTEVMAGLGSGWIRFYRATDGADLGGIYQGKAVAAASYSPQGTHVASCDADWTWSYSRCSLFERGGALRATFNVPNDERGHERWTGVAFSTDSTTLATSFKNDVASDPNVGGIYLWPTGLPATPITPAVHVAMATPNSFTVHPHGRYQFDFNLAANHPGVVIHLSGTASSDATYAGTAGAQTAVELFGAHGTSPSPAAHDDSVALTSTRLAGDILVERAVSGTYSVLVRAPMLTGGSIAATIRADYDDFHLSRAETNAAGNAGEVTIRIRGTGLDRTNVTARLVSPTSAVLDAVRIVDRGDTRLFATFDLKAAAPGAYGVQVERSDAAIRTLTDAVQVTAGTGPALRYAIEGPPAVRRGRAYTFTVNWENTGDSDAVAPFVAVTAPSTNAFLSDGGGFKMNSRMWLGASDGWPGHIIPARTRGRAVFQASFTTAYALHIKIISADSTPFQWDAIMAQAAPPDPVAWNAAALKIGTSRAQVFDTLRRVAAFSSNSADYNVLLRTALWLAKIGAFDQDGFLPRAAPPPGTVAPSSSIKTLAPSATPTRRTGLCRSLGDAAQAGGAIARFTGATLDSDGRRTSRAIVTELASTFCKEVAP